MPSATNGACHKPHDHQKSIINNSTPNTHSDFDDQEVVILFTRFPEPGKTKTRLIESLGAKGAAEVQREMTEHIVARLQPTLNSTRHLEVRFAGGNVRKMQHWLGHSVARRFLSQGEGDLGERLNRAVLAAFQAGARAVVLIGADCPDLSSDHIDAAFRELAETPVVFGPAADGGYYLLGLRRPVPQLFLGVPWGTNAVLAHSQRRAGECHLKFATLEELSDVDEPVDLEIWHSARAKSRALSIIIPTLNDAEQLAKTLPSITTAKDSAHPVEIIVADGGSVDETVRVAHQFGAQTVSGIGRARQMNAGAAAARGEIFLFLHADTTLPVGFPDAIDRAFCRPTVVAGAFRFRVRERFAGRFLLQLTTNLRSSWRQMPYGDQGLFVRRWVFERLGGFPDMPIMEDYEFVRRLRSLGAIVTLRESVLTSGRRWLALGLIRTTFINQLMILGYRFGVSPERLAAFYRRSRAGGSRESKESSSSLGPAAPTSGKIE